MEHNTTLPHHKGDNSIEITLMHHSKKSEPPSKRISAKKSKESSTIRSSVENVK